MAEPEHQEKTKRLPALADQAERSLKEANRVIKEANADSAELQLEQARVLALLELANAIRGTRGPQQSSTNGN
jgi:serine phosphatase RsbU (regulator of sigma subunit)